MCEKKEDGRNSPFPFLAFFLLYAFLLANAFVTGGMGHVRRFKLSCSFLARLLSFFLGINWDISITSFHNQALIMAYLSPFSTRSI